MTEKEFENLKVGDKVWYRRPSADFKTTEVVCREVRQKSENRVLVDCLTHNCHCGGTWRYWHEGSLTKSEEWEEELRGCEENAKYAEMDLVGYKKSLAHAKSELAKAKEEEERAKKVWFVDFRDDDVKCFDKEHWERSIESAYFKNKSYVKICDTEQEAYEAFSKHLEIKLFKALEKCGYKFAICCDKNIAVVKIDTVNDEFLWGHYYPRLSYGSIRKTNVFDTLEEAEAELERRLRS